MGIVLIVMMFVAMLLLGWWEIRRSRRRFHEAKQRLNTIYGDVKDQPDSEKSIQADILRESSQAVDSKTEKSHWDFRISFWSSRSSSIKTDFNWTDGGFSWTNFSSSANALGGAIVSFFQQIGRILRGPIPVNQARFFLPVQCIPFSSQLLAGTPRVTWIFLEKFLSKTGAQDFPPDSDN